MATKDFKFVKAMLDDLQAASSEAAEKIKSTAGILGRKANAGMVLVSTAALDRTLERAIETKLPSLNREFRDKLFGEFGALRDFSAKSDLAFALGIIDRPTYRRLTAIRRVRNLFAHTDRELSCESTEVRDLLAAAPGVSGSDLSIVDFNKLVVLADESLTSAAGIPSHWNPPGKPKAAQPKKEA